MKHGSLFSGIGGFDYAAQMMGWENVFHCEKEPFCKRILEYYWPNAISHDDIKQTNFSIHRGSIDILTGGFPCQPYSTAGQRKGKEDDRHLWPEMLRAIREIQPRWIVGENVRGLISWNGGLVFDEVQTDLEAEGYEVFPYLLPACGVNAPHRRERIWFVAYSDSYGHELRGFREDRHSEKTGKSKGGKWQWLWDDVRRAMQQGLTPNSSRQGLPKPTRGEQRSFYQEKGGITGSKSSRAYPTTEQWKDFPTQSPVCGGNDGLPRQLDGITFSRWRRESIKGYGNAIVPQVAFRIFKAIEQYENIQ